MIYINQLINNLSRYFETKIVIFNDNKLLIKSEESSFNKDNSLDTPRKDVRKKLFNHSHPIINNTSLPYYVFVPVFSESLGKIGVIWIFSNNNDYFINITDKKLHLINTLSEEICFSNEFNNINNERKLYKGILEYLNDNSDIDLQIFTDENEALIETNNINNDTYEKILNKNFYSNGCFIGGFKTTSLKNISLEVDTSKQNILFKSEKYNRIIGRNPQLNHVLHTINQVAKTNSTVLLRGESGTGKEQFAKIIHSESSRNRHPFIAINCAAIPENLLESELFGYEEGSFTGANKSGKIGKIETANKGTLFLDEIGDMSLPLQVKLLRVIQERCIEKIGSNRLIPVDIRIICATNKDLEGMIQNGDFREDLFYRINVIPITLSSLSNNQNDIELLLNYYLKKYCILQKKGFMKFSFEALECLKNYKWPGNIRELINAIEYCVAMTNDETIILDNLPIKIKTAKNNKIVKPANKKTTISKEYFLSLLEKTGNSTEEKKMLAKQLNISTATLYRWIQKYRK